MAVTGTSHTSSKRHSGITVLRSETFWNRHRHHRASVRFVDQRVPAACGAGLFAKLSCHLRAIPWYRSIGRRLSDAEPARGIGQGVKQRRGANRLEQRRGMQRRQ